jgi:hypothetical protein
MIWPVIAHRRSRNEAVPSSENAEASLPTPPGTTARNAAPSATNPHIQRASTISTVTANPTASASQLARV